MRRSWSRALAVAFLPAAAAQSAVSQTCPSSSSGICYSLSIPDRTAQSGSGDIFFQITAPATSHEWVSLGQGRSMTDSNIFVVYLSADGTNVTVSARLGVGHVEPKHSGQAAELMLLAGSGVENGKLTANVRCLGCSSWTGGAMDFSGPSGSWIYASKAGTPIQSDDVGADISIHDDYGVFNWDFGNAKGGEVSANSNPFLTTAASAASVEATGGGVPDSYIIAHAVFACLAVAFVLPIGGILIRVAHLPNLLIIHSAIQYLGLSFYIVAFGLGAYYASKEDYWSDRHPIIGTVVFALMLTQPLWGILHHRMYKKKQGRTLPSWLHLGVGRMVILLGIINGGLGLQLGGKSTGAKVGYGVGAGLMGLLYVLAILYGEYKRTQSRKNPSSHDRHLNGEEMEQKDSASS